MYQFECESHIRGYQDPYLLQVRTSLFLWLTCEGTDAAKDPLRSRKQSLTDMKYFNNVI